MSGIRAFIFRITRFINPYISRNDSLAITGLIFFVFNPFLLLRTALVLSFATTFFINIILDKKYDKTATTVLISLTAFIISVPLVSTFNNTFNILSPFMVIVLTPMISFYYVIVMMTLPFIRL
ncbi:MAG: hypothetical protein DRP42_04990 [Tenericutes bacterium]|nr:MAG: hypothetical protein DRP42_04990 [Mycoplasmatota bacterium]